MPQHSPVRCVPDTGSTGVLLACALRRHGTQRRRARVLGAPRTRARCVIVWLVRTSLRGGQRRR